MLLRAKLWRHNNLHVESTSQTKLHSRESVQACYNCYTLEFSLEKTCEVIGSVHPVRKCSKWSKADQSQSRFGTVQVNRGIRHVLKWRPSWIRHLRFLDFSKTSKIDQKVIKSNKRIRKWSKSAYLSYFRKSTVFHWKGERQNSGKNGLTESGCCSNVRLDGQRVAIPNCFQINWRKIHQVWWLKLAH